MELDFRIEGLAPKFLYHYCCLCQVSENAILFMAYGMCQKGVLMLSGKSDIQDLNVLHKATAGGLAAFFSSLALCPTELIKCKQQAMQEMMSTGQLAGGLADKAHSQHV